LFWLLRFYTKTESFGVSIEPKQTEKQPKQFDRKLILVFFQKIWGFACIAGSAILQGAYFCQP
jgi:hypothetical protein